MEWEEPTAARQPRRTELRSNTLMESVYQDILSRLQRGQVGPEDRILDYEVAEEFGCTRMPVRQALLRLVNEGYLIGTTRGFVIPVLTPQDVREIFGVRRLLEPGAAAGVAETLSDAQLTAMASACRKCRRGVQKRDVGLLVDASGEFRAVWLDAISNSRLKGEILRFADHAMQVRRNTLSQPEAMKLLADSLQRLLDAFIERNPKQVRSRVEASLNEAERQYFLDSGHG